VREKLAFPSGSLIKIKRHDPLEAHGLIRLGINHRQIAFERDQRLIFNDPGMDVKMQTEALF
jgi:hypothetical protein